MKYKLEKYLMESCLLVSDPTHRLSSMLNPLMTGEFLHKLRLDLKYFYE